MPAGIGYNSPEEAAQAEQMRQQGIPEELIKQIFLIGRQDPTGLSRQYDAGAFLRRAATSGDFAKSAPGVVAQGMAGAMVGMKDKEYAKAMREFNNLSVDARQAWFDQYRRRGGRPQTGQVTDRVRPEEQMPGDYGTGGAY